MILAIALGALAVLSLGYMLFGASSSSKPQVQGARPKSSPSPRAAAIANNIPSPADIRSEAPPVPVTYKTDLPSVPEASRNIFSFYVPPPSPSPTQAPVVIAPLPSPSPPAFLLTSISPLNTYARTGDFTLEVTGDRFPPMAHVYLNDVELPTHYTSPRQLSATVPGALITTDGARVVTVRTPDGRMFSNNATLNVMAPPTPNYLYVGLIGSPLRNDTAILKDKATRELLNVRRGDLLGGRYRVTSIADREVILTDTSLKIKHTIPFTSDNPNAGNVVGPRYPAPRPADDDEP